MNYNIPYGKHYISSNDVKKVVSALKSDFITQGEISINFENALVKKVKSNYKHGRSFNRTTTKGGI